MLGFSTFKLQYARNPQNALKSRTPSYFLSDVETCQGFPGRPVRSTWTFYMVIRYRVRIDELSSIRNYNGHAQKTAECIL
jgi:hypothetical protein